MDVSQKQTSFCDPYPTVFLSFSLFLWTQTGFEAKTAYDPSHFVNHPTYEPSRVDIQFYYNFKKIYLDVPLELPKDDQVLLFQGFNDVLSPKRDDGKRLSSSSENLKNGSPDQKSRCRTCAQACYSPFKLSDYHSRTQSCDPLVQRHGSRALEGTNWRVCFDWLMTYKRIKPEMIW